MSDQEVSLISAIASSLTRNNLQASRWHLIDYRNVQITIYSECQGARNRCSCHHKHMRMIALLPQNISLFNPEAVLFINNYQSQSRKINLFLNDRMCANSHHCLTILNSTPSHSTLAQAQTACKQDGTNTKRL